MTVDDRSAASRQFVASSVAYSPIWEKASGNRASRYWQTGFWLIVVLAVLITAGPSWGIRLGLPKLGAAAAYGVPAAMVLAGAAIGGYLFWRSRRKYVITVTSGGLTIDRRRGDVYSLIDAQLGLWVGKGVALHLRSGRHRFLLGGRDRRVDPRTPLEAPPVQLVDAWLSQSDFDQLLSSGGRWSGAAARGPAQGQQIRCVLFPNPLLAQQMGSFAFRKTQRLMASLSQPQLFVDIDNDTIKVIDSDSNALTASALLSQATATPATYRLAAGHADTFAGESFSTMPAMAVAVGGMRPLTIGCRDYTGPKQRFSWRENVPVTSEPPAYAVSAADWLALVDKLGLAAHLDDVAG